MARRGRVAVRLTAGAWGRARFAATSAVVLLSIGHASTAQEILRTWDVANTSAVWIEDLDGDGYRDLVAGLSYYDLPRTRRGSPIAPLTDTGRVQVLSGATGAVIREHIGPAENANLGYAVFNAGDVDGDGKQEYAANAFSPHGDTIYSGADGRVLLKIPAVASMVSLGDRDGDAREELLVGTWNGFEIHSQGLTRKSVFVSPVLGYAFGHRLAVLDGKATHGGFYVAISAPGYEYQHSGRGPGKVVVLGGDGTYLGELSGLPGIMASLNTFGSGLVAPGDLNGDGKGDLVVGGDFIRVNSTLGMVSFYDGETGALFAELGGRPEFSSHWGEDITAAGDLNGNGYPDLLVASRGPLLAIDGGTRETLYEVPISRRAAPGVADWNGDDFPDFLKPLQTRLELVSGAPRGVRVESATYRPDGGVDPRIGATGAAFPGASVQFHLSRVPPGQVAKLVITALPPRGNALLGGRRYGWPRVVAERDAQATQVRPGEGIATVALQVPSDPALIGSHFFALWQLFDSAGQRQATTRTLDFEVLAQ